MSDSQNYSKSIPGLPILLDSGEQQSSGQEGRLANPDYFSILKEQTAHQMEITASLAPHTAVLITSTGIGQGDHQLGHILMKGFLYSLSQLEEIVRYILFVNSGVFLATEGSDVLPHLHVLEERGVQIISSSTCLEYYHLSDKLCIGTTANMFTITEKLMNSLRVITL